jgi:hypothetical protein
MFLPLNIYMVVASPLLGVAADQVPTYDFGQNCHSIATLNNSIERCANDEEDAHGKLRTLWADFSAADKERCEAVTRVAELCRTSRVSSDRPGNERNRRAFVGRRQKAGLPGCSGGPRPRDESKLGNHRTDGNRSQPRHHLPRAPQAQW